MLVAIVAIVMASLAAIVAPFAKAMARKIDKEAGASQLPSDVEARLVRIEQAIAAVAVEIERISEGQRFTTKLLSEPRPTREAEPR
jgi:hypothetical protein